MINNQICHWLIENGDTPIRYRVFREFLNSHRDAKALEFDLIRHPDVSRWLRNLKYENRLKRGDIYHGSFDENFENAMLKCIRHGLHSELYELREAVEIDIMNLKKASKKEPRRNWINGLQPIIAANLLIPSKFNDESVLDFMLYSLEELHTFVSRKSYDIYLSEADCAKLKGIPQLWKNRRFIQPELTEKYGFCYPLLYDLHGLHKLYDLNDERIREKVDDIIRYIACDEYHDKIEDGYGILVTGDRRYLSMGWDAKLPGWKSIGEYMKSSSNMSRLLAHGLAASKYTVISKTEWFRSVVELLKTYRTGSGTYCFPPGWLSEKAGYAVNGSHMSFGENRRKRNCREIESTFYMQLLTKDTDYEI